MNMQLWQELSLATCQTLINQALSQDLAWATHAKALEGRRVLFHMKTVEYHVLARCHRAHVELSFAEPHAEADLIVSATPKACLEALRDKSLPRSIHIAGDANLAQHLQAALFNAHIDWEGFFALHVGELPARALQQGLRHAGTFLTRLKANMLADTHDYLLDEQKLVASAAELQDFSAQITELRYASDRLEARIQALQAKDQSCS